MAHFPLLYSPFTYLAPSSCDTNRPPKSRVARKLTPFPIGPLYPSLRNPDPPWVFPRLNVHSIRAVSQTQLPVYDTVVVVLALSPTALMHIIFRISSRIQTRIRKKSRGSCYCPFNQATNPKCYTASDAALRFFKEPSPEEKELKI
jgi:hypothetical protein